MSDARRPRLPPNQGLIKTPERWPVVGEAAPRSGDDRPWTIEIAGLVASATRLDLAALKGASVERRRVDFHCVTRWSKFDMVFVGTSLTALIQAAGPGPEARHVRLVARSERDHDTCLSLADVDRLDPLIAWAADLGDGRGEQALPIEHGGPVRVITPGKYGYKSLKWLERIELMAEPVLGYWESGPGYHDHADPWAEERYVTGNVPPDLRDRMIAMKRLGPRDLVSVDFSAAALAGAVGEGVAMRNCRFDQADLRGARMAGANLSNASLRGADLREADLTGVDAEGADFSGADLRGAQLGDVRLFGASFSDAALGDARLSSDALTETQIAALVDEQASAARRAMGG